MRVTAPGWIEPPCQRRKAFYNASASEHAGREEAVITAKQRMAEQRKALVDDYERGASAKIQPQPWQTETCIAQWHYRKGSKYKTVGTVVRMLVNIVSKNGI